jgi:hypothetical protein
MATASDLTAEEFARYRAAALLRDESHARSVLVFGSLVHRGCFMPWSDVDVAARGSTHATPCGRWSACGTSAPRSPSIWSISEPAPSRSGAPRSTVEREGRPV